MGYGKRWSRNDTKPPLYAIRLRRRGFWRFAVVPPHCSPGASVPEALRVLCGANEFRPDFRVRKWRGAGCLREVSCVRMLQLRRIRFAHPVRRDFRAGVAYGLKNPCGNRPEKESDCSCKHDVALFSSSSLPAFFGPCVYFLLKKFIVLSQPMVVNERIASPKTLSRSGNALRSSSDHSPST